MDAGSQPTQLHYRRRQRLIRRSSKMRAWPGAVRPATLFHVPDFQRQTPHCIIPTTTETPT
jgi:hypothetical protein